MEKSWIRRPVIGSGIAFLTIALFFLAPIWIPVLALVDAVRGRWRFPLVRFAGFGFFWCLLEMIGIWWALLLWCTGQGHNVRLHYKLQTWWTKSLIQALGFTVGLSITVEGAENLGDGPYVALCRHASLADSIMSAWVVATHAHLQPRYVLKKELKVDPCLDILGHRLPNYFIDRQSSDVSAELMGIEQMANGLGAKDCAVIFPEGSRASGKKRARALERLRERSPERATRLEGLQYLIAPKPAGASALLNAVPNANVVTMWHSGFDGLDTFKGVLKHLGSQKARVHVKVQRHERSTVSSGEQFVEWLDAQWVHMDQAVARQLASIA